MKIQAGPHLLLAAVLPGFSAGWFLRGRAEARPSWWRPSELLVHETLSSPPLRYPPAHRAKPPWRREKIDINTPVWMS